MFVHIVKSDEHKNNPMDFVEQVIAFLMPIEHEQLMFPLSIVSENNGRDTTLIDKMMPREVGKHTQQESFLSREYHRAFPIGSHSSTMN
jgi:hypothetical protein